MNAATAPSFPCVEEVVRWRHTRSLATCTHRPATRARWRPQSSVWRTGRLRHSPQRPDGPFSERSRLNEDQGCKKGLGNPETAEFLPLGYRRRRTSEVVRLHLWARLRVRAGARCRSALFQCSSGIFFLVALSFTSCARPQEEPTGSGAELRIGVPEGNADGTELGVGQLAKNMTLEALTQISAEGRALPRLAESWTWEDNGRRLRLRLRAGVVLHDGRQFDAHIAAEALAREIA